MERESTRMGESARLMARRSADRMLGQVPHGLIDAGVWMVLVALGVAGRLFQPTYNVTPLAGVGLAAAALFGRPGGTGTLFGWGGVAATLGVPLASLTISNLMLPSSDRSYGGFVMATVVFAATLWPALLGLLSPAVRRGRPMAWVGAALSHSLLFFVATNTAFWWLFDTYPHTAEGLGTCFLMALPFFRWMPVGDVAWSLGLLLVVRTWAGWRSSSPVVASPLRFLRP